ncbi:MAG: hypothetical protein WAS56_02435 [Saprospiraceae bacterium]
MRIKLHWIAFLIPIIFLSCRDQIEKKFIVIQTPSNDELTGISLWSDKDIFVVGGDTWTRALRLSTNDGGASWKRDSLYDKKIFAISSFNSSEFWTAGIDLITRHSLTQYKNYFYPSFRFYKGIEGQNKNTAIAVGGEAFRIGFIDRLNDSGKIENTLELDHELNAIQKISDNVYVAAGFGIVLRSEDNGFHWDTLDIDGDHFKDIASFDKASIIIGNFGTILRSTNSGKSYDKIRNASSIFVSDQSFRCIAMSDEKTMLIAGIGGLAWLSNDGGDSWCEIENLPDIDFYAAAHFGNKFYLCGSEGKILVIED